GATVCTRKNPACSRCPVARDCVALRDGRIEELPAVRKRKTLPLKHATWLVLLHQGEVLLERRPGAGIWGGLWVFPEASNEARAHPGARIEQERPGEQPLAVLGHDPLEQLPAGEESLRQRRVRAFRENFDVGDDQPVGPDPPVEHAEAFTALRDELQETELLH